MKHVKYAIALAVIVIGITSCAAQTVVTECVAFEPIYLEDSFTLSDRDKEKIADHNEVWEKLCAEG